MKRLLKGHLTQPKNEANTFSCNGIEAHRHSDRVRLDEKRDKQRERERDLKKQKKNERYRKWERIKEIEYVIDSEIVKERATKKK